LDWSLLAILAVGVGAGVLSGFFGIGGGTVFVPALAIGFGLHQLDAEATSLAAMLPVALLGGYRQFRIGLVDLRAATIIGGVSIVGVLVGASLAEALPAQLLSRLFGAFLLLVAAQLVRTARRQRAAEAGSAAE
jgi:uncharacterized membrane protein YfcA